MIAFITLLFSIVIELSEFFSLAIDVITYIVKRWAPDAYVSNMQSNTPTKYVH
jgi:hypothetical protein